jgi:hypothetical protein
MIHGIPPTGVAEEPKRRVRQPSLADAIIPLVTLAVLIAGSLLLFGLDALDGPIQVALMLSAPAAALIVLKNGHSWEEIQHAAQGPLASIITGSFILLAAGALVFSVIKAPQAGWGSARTLGGIAAGLAILAVFVVWEFRAAHPGAQRAVLPRPAAAGREPVDLHPVLRSSAAPSSCCSACRACVATAPWLRRCRCCRWRRR